MTLRWIQVIQLVLVSSASALETSEEYLRKAMHELQGLHAPFYPNYSFLAGKRYSRTGNSLQVHQVPRPVYPPNKSEPEAPQYYPQMSVNMPVAVPDPTTMPDSPPGFTKDQLVMMYNQALQAGSTLNMPGLKNVLESGQIPAVVGNSLQSPDSQQQFAYYFYPLKSFMDNFQSNNGFKTINDLMPQQSVQESQKQIVINPLFMAMSSFVGMALVFMFAVIVIPRIMGEFRSRIVHDELLDLTTTVGEAIDKYGHTTSRPKTPFSEATVGIKTRPVQRVKRKKIKRNRTVI